MRVEQCVCRSLAGPERTAQTRCSGATAVWEGFLWARAAGTRARRAPEGPFNRWLERWTLSCPKGGAEVIPRSRAVGNLTSDLAFPKAVPRRGDASIAGSGSVDGG